MALAHEVQPGIVQIHNTILVLLSLMIVKSDEFVSRTHLLIWEIRHIKFGEVVDTKVYNKNYWSELYNNRFHRLLSVMMVSGD